jgi:hypothetical protein
MTWNSFFTPVDMVGPVLTRWTRFWPKMTVLTPKRPETHFLPWSTWFDPYWLGGLGFDRKWRFWPENGLKLIFYPGRHGLTRIDSVDSVLTENDGFDPKRLETYFLLWSTCFDPYWLGGLGFDPKTHFLLGRHGLTCIDPVESVLMERCGWLEKNIFVNFPFS